MGGLDQLQLTAEEKDETIFKSLGSSNPQAPQNLTQFSFKKRQWDVVDAIDHMVIHHSMDGAIVMKESEEHVDQEDYWDSKVQTEKRMLQEMNKAILEEYGNEPFEGQDERTQKKSLRNQFNYQERSS
jgi:hypothetical protein